MTVHFTVPGQTFMALNGGLGYPFTQAVSLMVAWGLPTQEELDATWERLGAGARPSPVGGSRTATVSPGKWSPPPWRA
jgi:predicted 3-demethylubiquinone-9 3-methyltransferase (glyoxalase superfamily)